MNIQAAWRGHVEKNNFTKIISNIITIQALTRRVITQRCSRRLLEERRQSESDAATRIQSSWRCYVENTEFIQTIADIVVIQTIARKFVARKKLQHFQIQCASARHGKENASAQTIQNKWRCFATKLMVVKMISTVESTKQIESTAATTISKYWRGFRCQQQYGQNISGETAYGNLHVSQNVLV